MKLLFVWSFVIMSSGPENGAAASSSSGGKPLAFAASSPDGISNEEVPQLPASDIDNKDIPTIKLGETIKFDEMGPVIINLDGTTRQIDNWSDLSEREKEVTWRRISKRNEERRKMLMEQAEKEEQEKDVEK